MKKDARLISALAVIVFVFSIAASVKAQDSDKNLQPVLSKYRIHIDDVLDISVWGVEGLVKTVTVRPDGRISFPLIGDVYALGKTPEQLSSEMEETLAEYVKEADVSILVLTFHKPKVFILGEIKAPGSYNLTGPYSLLQLLAEAKLVNPGMTGNTVNIIREGKSTLVSLDISNKGDDANASNFKLEDGDVVYVAYEGVASVRVMGASMRSTKFPIPGDPSNIAEVLAAAGELNEYIISYGVKLIRGTEVMHISLSQPPEDFEMKNNDVIYVPQTKKETVTVTGYVNSPGVYQFVRGYTLLDAIQVAGGFDSKGSMDLIEIFRETPEGTQVIKAGDLYNTETKAPELKAGDVVYVNKRKDSVGKFFLSKVIPAVRDVSIISSLLKD